MEEAIERTDSSCIASTRVVEVTPLVELPICAVEKALLMPLSACIVRPGRLLSLGRSPYAVATWTG